MSELNQTMQAQVAAALGAENVPEEVREAINGIEGAVGDLLQTLLPALSKAAKECIPHFATIGKYLKEADE